MSTQIHKILTDLIETLDRFQWPTCFMLLYCICTRANIVKDITISRLHLWHPSPNLTKSLHDQNVRANCCFGSGVRQKNRSIDAERRKDIPPTPTGTISSMPLPHRALKAALPVLHSLEERICETEMQRRTVKLSKLGWSPTTLGKCYRCKKRRPLWMFPRCQQHPANEKFHSSSFAEDVLVPIFLAITLQRVTFHLSSCRIESHFWILWNQLWCCQRGNGLAMQTMHLVMDKKTQVMVMVLHGITDVHPQVPVQA